jgi:CarD family transcriptional regulator
MSSVKKTEKSRKAKAVARAARTTAAKTGKASATKARPTRSKTRTTTRSATKTARKPASASAKSATKPRSAPVKKPAAKAARPTKSTAAKSVTPPPPRRTKPNQNTVTPKLNRSTSAARGKSPAGRSTPVEAKLHKAAAAIQQPAASQTEPKAVVKKVDSERSAQVAAVLALRSLRKPAPAAEPVARPEEASKASVTQKAPKKAAEAAPAPTRVEAPVTPKAAAPSTVAAPAAKPQSTAEAKPVAPMTEKPKTAKPAAPVKHGFKPLEFVVYPAHGVGQILAIEEQEVAGFKLELFVVSFSKDKMILKVPTEKKIAVGMRKLAGPEVVKQALNTLTGRARIKRTMWSRRAQEYEAKINSGDLVAIAEVVRDLYRSEAQPEQSYSERQLYEAALDRVAREIAAVQKLTETESLKVIEAQLQKSPRRGKADDADIEAEAEAGEDGGIDEAA